MSRLLDATTGLSRTRSSLGDGTVRGRARLATPYNAARLRQAAQASGEGNRPLGETITVQAASQQIAESGSQLEFTQYHPVLIGAGFEEMTLPVLSFRSPLLAYYRLDVKFRWASYVGPTSVWVNIRGQEAHRVQLPNADRFMGVFDCGVMFMGDTAEVWAAPA